MKNHFIPDFYLSRWATTKGELIEYRLRGSGEIKGKPRSPKGTGYKPDLYKNTRREKIEAHIFELGFLQKHDDLAAKALDKFEKGINPSDKEVCGWISFLMALLMRHPDDIAALRCLYEQKWKNGTAELQSDYSKVRGEVNPEHINNFIEQKWPGIMEEAMFKTLERLMEHEKIGQLILEFEHSVTTLKSTKPLITSDRPLLMTQTLTEEHAYIILPVGPKKVYVCGKTQNTVQRILNKTGDEFTEIINDQIARHATISVYSSNSDLEKYVEERLGTRKYESFFTRMNRIQ
jgi:hypothetical protein